MQVNALQLGAGTAEDGQHAVISGLLQKNAVLRLEGNTHQCIQQLQRTLPDNNLPFRHGILRSQPFAQRHVTGRLPVLQQAISIPFQDSLGAFFQSFNRETLNRRNAARKSNYVIICHGYPLLF